MEAATASDVVPLTLARELAGPNGRIACIDTEHGSLSKYADIFSFDVHEPASYTIEHLLKQLDYAEENGYAVFCVDSLSHFWMGKDGALELVDNKREVKVRLADMKRAIKAGESVPGADLEYRNHLVRK